MTPTGISFSSPGRQRMAVLAISSALFTLVESAFGVIGPLWATRDLGLDNADWAFLRAAGELGGFLSILAFGVLAGRLGTRRMSMLALIGAGLTFAALSSSHATTALMALLGAFTSIIYVMFNTLAQRVSPQRQSLANALYRAAGASAAIVAPALATQAARAFGAYTPVLVIAALVLGTAGLVVATFPEADSSTASRTFAQVFASYRRSFTLRPLLAFIAITRLFGVAVAAIGAFAALRFTRELGMSEPAFGVLCTVAACGSLLALLGSGPLVDRLRPSGALAFAWVCCSVAAMILGVSTTLWPAIVAYVLFLPLQAMCSVPLSLWSSRIVEQAGADAVAQSDVFTVQKVFQSGTTMLVMALLGLLEPLVGMGTLMWCGGLLGLPLALAVRRLGRAQDN